jgi:two-component system sensor kinase
MPPSGLDSHHAGCRIFGDRFLAERLLKTSQGVDTYYGADRLHASPVIIKVLSASSVSASVQLRLEHEAKVLADIHSSSLSPLLYFGRDADLLYLVMPYIPGVTLQSRLRQGALSVREAVTVGCRIVAALGEAHDHGVLHQDVKPANLIVDETGTIERVTLIDFGFARSRYLSTSIREQPVGTIQYMAPEQAGLLNQGVSERSDLYSAGIVLYETLAGRPPFEAATVGDLLRMHVTAKPQHLRSLGVPVPRALDAVVQRLLRKDPRDRYQSAEAVLADLSEIGDALDRGVADPAIVVGQRDQRRSLTEPAFIGRVKELSTLAARMDAATTGEGGLILLEAQSGGGKTWVLDELGQRCQRQAMWVLRGQGLDQSAQRPFQMLVGAVADLVMAARSQPALAADIQERLGIHREALCAALPELAELLSPESSQRLGPEAFGETRTLQALTALLNSIGSPERPVLLLLDDGQWADELTLKLLGHWQSQISPARPEPAGTGSFPRNGGEQAPLHVLIVVAFRSEEVPEGHPLRACRALQHIVLDPFGRDDVRDLVESMAGVVPGQVIDVVSELSEGSPFMASAVLRGLVESGALLATPAGWVIEPTALADLQSSRRAATFLARRLDLLPMDVRVLLSIGAVLGKEFDIDLAASLAQQTPVQAVAAMEEARRRHIIWSRAQCTRCIFVHDKLRETLLQRLSGDHRRELHRLAAQRLAVEHPDRIFDLAYHFDAAGEFERALPYALCAAEQARAQHALEIAEQQYRIAARGIGGAEDDIRHRIAEGLGDVLTLRGSYGEAQQQFNTARASAKGQVAQAQIEGKLGDLAFRRGDVKMAAEAVERALRLVGKHVPRSSIMFGIRLFWEVLVQAVHTALPGLCLARRQAMSPEELLATRLYSRLAYIYWFQRGKVPCGWAHLREMNVAERYPPSLELAQAYSEHAPVMTMLPWYSRGIAYAQKSLAIRTECGDVWGQGQSLHFYGVVLYAASRFSECIEKCQEAMRVLERTGDQWEVNTAAWHIAFCRYRVGDLRGAVDLARRVHTKALEIGDHQAAGIALGAWAKASGGTVPRLLIEAELQRDSEDVHTKSEVWQAEAIRLINDGSPGEAAMVLENAHRVVAKAGLRQEYVAPILPWYATALRQQAEHVPVWAPEDRRRILARARRAGRQAVRLARHYRNNLPHALREHALVAAMCGDPQKARRFLDEALAVAQQQGSRYEHAQTLLARGRVGGPLGWPDAAEDVTQARRLLHSLEVSRDEADFSERPRSAGTETLSLIDRFGTVLEAGRKIASSLSTETVLAAVRDGALRLLRGEQCVVLTVADDGTIGEYSARATKGDYSRTLVQQALTAGRPVSVVEGGLQTATESLILPNIRSAMCAPVFVRGRPQICFYITHRQVDGLFGEEEERLAEYIATLAGAALENAEGFADLRAAQEQLRFQKTLLECQSEATVDGLLLVSSEGRILSYNHCFADMWGIPAEALTARSDAAALRSVVSKLVNPDQFVAKVSYLYEHPDQESRDEIMLKDGRTFDRSTTPVKSADGVYYGRLWHFRDITERKRGEVALRVSQARLAGIIEAAMDAIITVDDRQTILLFNAAAESMFRCKAARVIGAPLRRFIPDLLPTNEQEKVGTGGASTSGLGSSRGVRADGEEFPIEASISDVQVGGERLHTIILRDITDRKRAEEELREINDTLSALVQASPAAINVLDPQGHVQLWNPAAERIFGWRAEDLLGRPLPGLPSGSDEEQQIFRRVLNNEAFSGVEVIRQTCDGGLLDMTLSAAPLRDASGQICGVMSVLVDISQRKQAEQALREAHDELELRVADRTKELFESNILLWQEVIERQRMENELRARAGRQSAIALLSQRARGCTDLGNFFKEVTVLVAATLSVDYCKILELLPDGKRLLLREGVGWRDGCVGRAVVNRGLESQAGYTLQSKEPVVVEDLRTETRFSGPPLLHEHEVVSGMSVIIPGEREPFGVFGVHTRHRRTFSPDDIQFLQVIANLLATTIIGVANEQGSAVHHAVSMVLTESRSLKEGAARLLEAICLHLEWEVGILWQTDQDAQVLRSHTVWHSSSEKAAAFTMTRQELTLSPGAGLAGSVWAAAQPSWVSDACGAGSPGTTDATFPGAFALPILNGHRVSWVMEFFNERMRRPDDGFFRTMVTIASQIGLFFERIRAEEALRESEERYRTVVETAADAVITVSESGTIVFANRAAEHIFGYGKADLLGQPLTVLMPELIPSAHETGLAHYSTCGRGHRAGETVHVHGRHVTGKKIPLELDFWEFTQQGKRYFSSLVRDITERMQAAEIRTRLLDQVISAQEEERGRIARELHDGAGQSLMALLVGLHAIETASGTHAAQDLARTYRAIAAQALDEVRRLAVGLRPSVLDDLGLAPAIDRYVTQYTQAYGIPVDVHITGLEDARLPSTVETTLYRIIQEALTNVAKHAGASIISVVIERQSTSVHAIIEDDGCGFDVHTALHVPGAAKHFGLHSMRERATLLSGTIAIESTPSGGGTTVYVTIPLQEKPERPLPLF